MDGFHTFFNETKGRFFNYLVRLTGDADRAADAFQESYLRCWERYDKKKPNVRLLFTIGRNLAVDGHRRRKNHKPIENNRRDDQTDQESALIIKETYHCVLSAMENLNPDEREILSLAADGGFRYEQIAEITGMSIANVKVKIHRARKKLRGYLEET